MAERILMNEYKSLQKERWVHVAVSQPPIVNGVNRFRHILHLVINDLTELQLHNDDIFQWDIALIVVNPDSMYYGGYFKAVMRFPSNYPYVPPSMSPCHTPSSPALMKLTVTRRVPIPQTPPPPQHIP